MFFFGLLTPRPRFLGRPSLWFMMETVVVPVVVARLLGDAEFSLRLGGLGESAVANSCTKEALGAPGGGWDEDGGTRRGLGPGFLRANGQSYVNGSHTTKIINYVHVS